MTLVVQTMKTRFQNLHALSSLQGTRQLLIERDTSSSTWGGVLIENIEGNGNVCGYGSGSFKASELNYPSSHKEILAVKKTVQHFISFLKPVKFVIRTDLKIMPRIFKNENLMSENSSRILKWFIWLSNFDYEIIYKPRYLNYFAYMVTKENSQPVATYLSMFTLAHQAPDIAEIKAKLQSNLCTSQEMVYF